jgi:E3 ubiquitin-protein ligase EDD1
MTVTEKEGGETYDLIPDGSSKDVTYSKLYEFIKRYAEFRMIHLVEQSLQHLRLGVFDVLPLNSLDYLSPEDFRLLLNGTSNINITTLMTYTTFNDESGMQNKKLDD